MPVLSSWFTAPRVRRLHEVLAAIPERSLALAEGDAKLCIWRRCGGPIDEVGVLVEVLVHAELVRREKASLRLTAAGRRTLTRNRVEQNRPLALALVRAGLLHDQARALLDSFPVDPDGSLTCRTNDARRVAPQLVGLVQLWTEVRTGSTLTIPRPLVDELAAVWALIAPPSEARAEQEKRRKSIGNRAEAYSYQLERLTAAAASGIVWVAQDDDTLGYDLEDRSTLPRRRIEVKGSGGEARGSVLHVGQRMAKGPREPRKLRDPLLGRDRPQSTHRRRILRAAVDGISDCAARRASAPRRGRALGEARSMARRGGSQRGDAAIAERERRQERVFRSMPNKKISDPGPFRAHPSRSPGATPVRRDLNMPGGGQEVTFDTLIPPEAIRRVR